MKLSQITGKNYNEFNISGSQEADVSRSVSGSAENFSEPTALEEDDEYEDGDCDEDDESEDDSDSAPSPDIRPIRSHSPELIELAMKWGATIGSTGKIVNNKITMSRKEFLKYSKNMTQEEVLADPLLYVMFRSDEQSQGSFWDFLARFPKEEYESDEQE